SSLAPFPVNMTSFWSRTSTFTDNPFIGEILANVFTSHLILFSVNLLMSIILFIFILNFFVGVLYRKGILDNISEIFTMTEQSELSEFFSDIPALFRPEAEKDKTEGQVIRYSSEKYLSGIPTQDNIVAENDEGLTAILEDALFNCQKIPFMVIDCEGSSQKINRKYCYVLRLYDSLINGQKAVVTLFGIRVFFDVLVPDGETPDECEMKVRDILSGEVKTQKIEHIKAFP